MAADDNPTQVANLNPAKAKAGADPDATVPVRARSFYEDDHEDDDDDVTHAIVAGVVKPRAGDGAARIQVDPPSGKTGPRIAYPLDTASDPVCAVLIVVEGPGQGVAIPVGGGRTSVGRGEKARLRLNLGDKALSGMHFILSYDEEDASFDLKEADEASSSTLVDGARVKSSITLKPGCLIKAGGTVFRFVPCVDQTWNWTAALKDQA